MVITGTEQPQLIFLPPGKVPSEKYNECQNMKNEMLFWSKNKNVEGRLKTKGRAENLRKIKPYGQVA